MTDEGKANGCFNERAITALAGRDVVLMPDLGATQEWQTQIPMLDKVCRSVSVNDILETMATEKQQSQGLDIANFLQMEDTLKIWTKVMEIEHTAVTYFSDSDKRLNAFNNGELTNEARAEMNLLNLCLARRKKTKSTNRMRVCQPTHE